MISVAMMMRNEEKVIGRAMGVAEKIGDEVVVLDTGSSDRSVEIARGFKKVVVVESKEFTREKHWSEFQFGKARNEGIRHCQGNWVMMLDCDDVIGDEGCRRVREIAGHGEVGVYGFIVKSGGIEFMQNRLFPLGVWYDEAHSCHEVLDTRGWKSFMEKGVVVEHRPIGKVVQSGERNLALLRKDYEDRGMRDPRTLFYYARALMEMGKWGEAEPVYGEYLGAAKWGEERMFARLDLGMCLWRLGRVGDAREQFVKARGEDGRYAEPMAMLGDLEASAGNWRDSYLWRKEVAKAKKPEGAMLFVNAGVYGEGAKRKLEEASAKVGAKKKAAGPKKAYKLPGDVRLAGVALRALEGMSRGGLGRFVAVTKLPLRSVEVEVVQEGDGMELGLPRDLRGRSEEWWYCRSAGFAG